jgi:hypothetical protein
LSIRHDDFDLLDDVGRHLPLAVLAMYERTTSASSGMMDPDDDASAFENGYSHLYTLPVLGVLFSRAVFGTGTHPILFF